MQYAAFVYRLYSANPRLDMTGASLVFEGVAGACLELAGWRRWRA